MDPWETLEKKSLLSLEEAPDATRGSLGQEISKFIINFNGGSLNIRSCIDSETAPWPFSISVGGIYCQN